MEMCSRCVPDVFQMCSRCVPDVGFSVSPPSETGSGVFFYVFLYLQILGDLFRDGFLSAVPALTEWEWINTLVADVVVFEFGRLHHRCPINFNIN